MTALKITMITVTTIAIFNVLGAGTFANIVSFIVFISGMIAIDRPTK